MAATLADSVYEMSCSDLFAARDRLRPGSVAYLLVDNLIESQYGYDPDEDGSDAYVRHLELRGYDDARFEEEMDMMRGLPA